VLSFFNKEDFVSCQKKLLLFYVADRVKELLWTGRNSDPLCNTGGAGDIARDVTHRKRTALNNLTLKGSQFSLDITYE
jgi:hypothetical protein